MENNKTTVPNHNAVNQSENHYSNMQTIVPAVVMSTGYAPDGEYYAEVVVFNTETNKQDHAFVRFSNERELANSYVDMYDNTTQALGSEKATQDAKTLMRKNAGKRDLQQKFFDKAKSAQENGQFEGKELGDIVSDNARGGVLMLKGITIVGEARVPDITNAADVGNKADKVLLLAANQINHSGLIKDHQYFKNDNLPDEFSPVADQYAHVEQAMVRMIYEVESQEAEAFKILPSAATINFDTVTKNPTEFLDLVSENANPTSDRVPSAPRQGFMDMAVNYKNEKNQDVSHRFTFHSNHFTGGEHFNKSPEEYLDLSDEWAYRGEKEAISRFIAGQDPFSNSKNPDPDVVAKSDVLRLGLRFASDYNFKKEFSDKINSGDKNAFKGITKFDYLSVPKEKLTPQQQMVVEFSESVVRDPSNTFLSITNFEKLNLPTETKKVLSESVKASIVKQTQDTPNNAIAQTAAARTAVGNSMLDVARANQYDRGKVNMVIIPATIVTDVAATEASSVSSDQSEDKEGVIWGRPTSQFYPSLSAVSNPVMDNGKYHKETRTLYSNTPPLISLIKNTTKDLNFDLNKFNSLGVLKGQTLPEGFKPDIDGNNFTKAFNYLTTQPPKDERLGYAKVANRHVTDRAVSSDLELSPKQLLLLPKNIFRREIFNTLAEKLPANEGHAKSRYAEFEAAMKNLVGPFSKENTTLSNLKIALNSPKGAELSEDHQKIKDMLLTDKLVELKGSEDDKDKSKSHVNFKDLASLAMNPSAKMDSPIRADINGEQIKVKTQDLNTHKENRVNEAINQAHQKLTDPQNNVSADDLVRRAMEATKPSPSMSPSNRF